MSSATADYRTAIIEVACAWAALIRADPTLPPLCLTQAQYETGAWPYPTRYAVMLKCIREQYRHLVDYRLTEAQLQMAVLHGATLARKLWIGGVLEVPAYRRRLVVGTYNPSQRIPNRFSIRRWRGAPGGRP